MEPTQNHSFAEVVKHVAVVVFIVAVVILVFVALLGVWEVIGTDSVVKAFSSGLIVLFGTVSVVIAARIAESRAK